MHERFGVPRRYGQRIHVDLLEGKLSALLLGRISGRQGRTEVIVRGRVVPYSTVSGVLGNGELAGGRRTVFVGVYFRMRSLVMRQFGLFVISRHFQEDIL